MHIFSVEKKHMDSDPHVQLAVDTAIGVGAVSLPVWAYQISAWAGFITMMIGLVVVILRLLIALRDWKAKPVKQSDLDDL